MHVVPAAATAPAWLALAGTVAGVIGGAGSALLTQQRGLKAAREDEAKRTAQAASAATMLLRIELGNARDAVWETRARNHWPIGWNRDWSGSWKEVREKLLADPPEEEVLRAVGAAFARIDELQNGVNKGDPTKPLEWRDQSFLWRMQKLLEDACEKLGCPSDEDRRPEDPKEKQLACWAQKEAQERAPSRAASPTSEPDGESDTP